MREGELSMANDKVVGEDEFYFGVGFVKSEDELELFNLLIGRRIFVFA